MNGLPDPLAQLVTRVKLEVLEDMVSGRVPVDVTTFAALHDYVDANEYGGLCTPGDPNRDHGVDTVAAMQAEITRWLSARHLALVDPPAPE